MIAILYPLKMDKNLSEAYSSIYESSLSAGEGDSHTMGTDGVARSKEQVANMSVSYTHLTLPTTGSV